MRFATSGCSIEAPRSTSLGFSTSSVDAAAANQPTFVAVPSIHLALLREHLDSRTDGRVELADMAAVGRNPARIIPAIRRFVDDHRGERVSFISEPIWPGRTFAEVAEARRHEAMINLAFADTEVDVLCPYDATNLATEVIDDSFRTHPEMINGDQRMVSAFFEAAEAMLMADLGLAAPTTDHVVTMAIDDDDLSDVRAAVRGFATATGVSGGRTQDLVIAANEIATNTVVHSASDGTLRLWRDEQSVVCEISDSGHIADLLAGRRAPDQTSDHGRGIWMANQLCDLTELRSTEAGTTVRLHVDVVAG